jgi:hypothetical protein
MEENKLKLEFLKRVLTDTAGGPEYTSAFFQTGKFPEEHIIENICQTQVDDKRLNGTDWPETAHTMIGLKRMNNLHESLDFIRINSIEGDFIETGVWRGGASIFAKLYFDLYQMNKKVFVADSFKGLPFPEHPEDENDIHHTFDYLSVSLNQVKNNFKLYRCLDENVEFLEGWFHDTLPNNDKIGKLSILRMDGDMYKSTMDVFDSCYPKLVKGGIVIIDDFCISNCKRAVEDFRSSNNYSEEIHVVDQCGIFWIKS